MSTILNNTKLYAQLCWNNQSVIEAYARYHGLQGKSLAILMWIYNTPQGITQNLVCQKTYSTKQVVNATIKSFLEKGYIKLEENKADKRQKLILLTSEGQRFAVAILKPLEEGENDAMLTLSESEQSSLLQLTERFQSSLTEILESKLTRREEL